MSGLEEVIRFPEVKIYTKKCFPKIKVLYPFFASFFAKVYKFDILKIFLIACTVLP